LVIAFAAMPAVPMGGRRDSGFGRIHGEEGLKEFTRTFSVTVQRFATPGVDLLRLRRSRVSMAFLKRAGGVFNRVPRGSRKRGSAQRATTAGE